MKLAIPDLLDLLVRRVKSALPDLRARREKPVPWALLGRLEQMEPQEI